MKRLRIDVKDMSCSHTIDKTPPAKLDVNHCHSNYEILYVVEGQGTYFIEGSTYPIEPGSLIIIRPFEYHGINVREDMPYERFVLHFSESSIVEDAANLLSGFAGDNGASGKYFSPQHISPGIATLFERFESLPSIPDTERRVYMKMLFSELIVLLSVSRGERMEHDNVELGARVIKYLNENITKNISLDKLARRFFVSKYYLCRAFKKHNGISVHGYINKKRVMYAKQLIDSGETASGAAYKVGFGDYSAFYRAYVKIIGKAPTA